jgi:hypothetical protein
LNDFFRTEALDHKKELLSETYSLMRATNTKEAPPPALISFCNDNIQLSTSRKKKILPREKRHYEHLPAVKIARLGVASEFQKKNIGTYLINMAKELFLADNRTGCRFITVDAYNNNNVLRFYKNNDFEFLSKKDEKCPTRIMYFDLKRLLTK